MSFTLLTIDALDELAFSPRQSAGPEAEEAAKKRATPAVEGGGTKRARSDRSDSVARSEYAPKRRSRKSKDEFSFSQRQLMFRFWCGNEEEGPCPVCKSQKLIRTEKRTWEIAHICSWAKGGSCELWNLFPCCSPCNKAAEFGGRRRGIRGVNHFEGMILDGFSDSARYGARLGSFIDRAYEWLAASGARDRDVDVAPDEDRAQVIAQWYGPSQPGGFSEGSKVLPSYETWLAVQAEHAALRESADNARQRLTRAEEEEKKARKKLAKFREWRGHYLEN